MTDVRLKRIYEAADPGDGERVLVERLWPRGVRKADARLDDWVKEVAPSDELRQWYGHDPARWPEFRQRYRAELAERAELLADLRRRAEPGPLTLVFAARDRERNSAAVLAEVLEEGA